MPAAYFGLKQLRNFATLAVLLCMQEKSFISDTATEKRLTGSHFLANTKGQIISEYPYETCNHFSQKTNEKISEISALASKERSNQKLY